MLPSFRGFKAPLKALAVSAGTLVAGFLLIGIPGPCGYPGMLDGLFRGHRGLEFGFSALLMYPAMLAVLLNTLWLAGVAATRSIRRGRSPS